MADKTVSQTISCQTDDLKNHVQTNTLKKIKELEDEVEKSRPRSEGLKGQSAHDKGTQGTACMHT